MYTEPQLVRIAKRENNNARKYLVVNALQAKHIPADPRSALKLFSALADELKEAYPSERLLLVGFAETATAIGAALASQLDSHYMQTTREDIQNVEYLFFTESHSHAAEQRLVKTDLDAVINDIQRIVFVEDELTTGNTILKIVSLIQKSYAKPIEFSAASILNGMDEQALQAYNNRNIALHYIVKTNHSNYTATAESFKGDGEYHKPDCSASAASVKEIRAFGRMDARRLVKGGEYRRACENMWSRIKGGLNVNCEDSVLVIGTEECMYPAIFIASEIDARQVMCHSTTRSPIEVSSEREYPLHSRYELASFYDKDRKTYVYDLHKYDKVLIITDAQEPPPEAINGLVNALKRCGNADITLVRWSRDEKYV